MVLGRARMTYRASKNADHAEHSMNEGLESTSWYSTSKRPEQFHQVQWLLVEQPSISKNQPHRVSSPKLRPSNTGASHLFWKRLPDHRAYIKSASYSRDLDSLGEGRPADCAGLNWSRYHLWQNTLVSKRYPHRSIHNPCQEKIWQ